MERNTNPFSVLEGQIFEVKVLVEKLIHNQQPVTLPDVEKYEAGVKVACEELGCKPQTVYQNINVIPHKKIHGKLLFNRAELRKYVKNEGAKK